MNALSLAYFKYSTIWWKRILVIINSILPSPQSKHKFLWDKRETKYRLNMPTLKLLVKSIKIGCIAWLRKTNLWQVSWGRIQYGFWPHRKHKSHQAINQINSQHSGWITGYAFLPLKEQPCGFNIPGSPTAYLWTQRTLCLLRLLNRFRILHMNSLLWCLTQIQSESSQLLPQSCLPHQRTCPTWQVSIQCPPPGKILVDLSTKAF